MDNRTRTSSMQHVMSSSTGLRRTMHTRDAVMVAVGGTIGTGLFLSSGDVIAAAGPGGAILAYLFGGLVIYLMTACLGEMAASMPVAGNIQAYCTEYINPEMGITVGWLSWLANALTITAQLAASAIIMKNIFPDAPEGLWIVLFAIMLFGINLFGAGNFGNISFYFASLKLILVLIFTILGLGMIFFDVGGGENTGFQLFLSDGLFPRGLGAVGSVILSAFYAFGGIEMLASTGGELHKEADMPKVINWTLAILVITYVISMVMLGALLPWQQADLNGSPFAYVFRNAGMTYGELLVNIFVLTSALTSCNYFIYASTRYMWSLSRYGQAPKVLSKTRKNGVPFLALVISLLFGLLGIVCQFFAPDTVYKVLIYLIGGANIFIYIIICMCQFCFRKRFVAEGGQVDNLPYRVVFPLTPVLGIIFLMAMLIISLLDPDEAVTFYICIPAYVIIYLASHIFVKKKGITARNIMSR